MTCAAMPRSSPSQFLADLFLVTSFGRLSEDAGLAAELLPHWELWIVTVQSSVIASGFCEAIPIVVGNNRCEAISKSASWRLLRHKKPCLAMTLNAYLWIYW